MCLIGVLARKKYTEKNGDWTSSSNEVNTKLISALNSLGKAAEAATTHKKALEKITGTWRSLEIPVHD